ncbi:hypothetical protein PPERSA_08429 [Pseudocohnilembus persalinus]|uniref:Uncharacterized protein n=1 Tax=Pseudocohnilembus persalinus TaxID=266149 RepID=A0A0V0R6P9_PSEPJ|nr:hypothetical protein PPERSA_08429 [Pseudocohnilembus persalinus]|eukprot:KRX10026.1 hypothetical protein PPERSA_08429 [Pseudocohnilembus persalinus]
MAEKEEENHIVQNNENNISKQNFVFNNFQNVNVQEEDFSNILNQKKNGNLKNFNQKQDFIQGLNQYKEGNSWENLCTFDILRSSFTFNNQQQLELQQKNKENKIIKNQNDNQIEGTNDIINQDEGDFNNIQQQDILNNNDNNQNFQKYQIDQVQRS